MIKKILLFSAMLAACMAIFAGPASAQYPDGATATIDDTTVVAGQAVTIAGTCAEADSVSLEIEGGSSLGTIDVDDDDSFSGSATIPSGAEPGDYTILLTCGTEVLSVGITVLASGGGADDDDDGGTMAGSGSGSDDDDDDDALARTGTEVDGLVKLGGGLLVAGAAAVLFATKRRSSTV